jgi:hypothetical protein
MERKLHLLETFKARGADGQVYVVRGYEHMTRLDAVADAHEDQWEPTGVAEYKLEDGRHVDLDASGALVVAGTGLRLEREPRG